MRTKPAAIGRDDWHVKIYGRAVWEAAIVAAYQERNGRSLPQNLDPGSEETVGYE